MRMKRARVILDTSCSVSVCSSASGNISSGSSSVQDSPIQESEFAPDVRCKVLIKGPEAHHLINVLRAPIGSSIELVLPDTGKTFVATIQQITSDQVTAIIASELPATRCAEPRITIIAGATKLNASEEIVRHGVEIGVHRIWFFEASRSQGRITDEKKETRLLRLSRIADSAIKQSGAASRPDIQIFKSLLEAIKSVSEDSGPFNRLVFSPPGSLPEHSKQPAIITEHFSRETDGPVALQNTSPSADFFLVVGPEGGLSHEEYALAVDSGFSPVSLGSRVLRAETAALISAAAVRLLASPR